MLLAAMAGSVNGCVVSAAGDWAVRTVHVLCLRVGASVGTCALCGCLQQTQLRRDVQLELYSTTSAAWRGVGICCLCCGVEHGPCKLCYHSTHDVSYLQGASTSYGLAAAVVKASFAVVSHVLLLWRA